MTRVRAPLISIVRLLLLMSCAAPNSLFAQTATATLRGAVLDESGAAVPGAQLTLVGFATVLERRLVSDAEGRFAFPFVPPGRYSLTARQDGFAPGQLEGIVLSVGDDVLLTLTLKVSSVSDTVSVTAVPSLVARSGTVATVIDRSFVANMPMNGRTFQSLLQLTPGVVPTPGSTTQQGQFSVNGARESANTFSVDGVSANVGLSPSGANFNGASGQFAGYNAVGSTTGLVSLDAMEELTVQTSGFAPEFGRTPGGQVAIVTRAGTNTLSGSLFEYFRHDALNANDFFANGRGIPKQQLRNNQFGGVLGGPIHLGRLYDGRSSSFFFFSYEGLRQRLPTIAIVDVPSAALRRSATGAAAAILNAFPAPTGPDTAAGVAQFAGGYSTPARSDATSLRLDHQFGNGTTVFGRYNYAPSEAATRGQSGNSLSVLVPTTFRAHTATLGTTSILSGRAVNELRLNVSRHLGHQVRVPDTYGGAAVPDPALLYPAFVSPDDAVLSYYLRGVGVGPALLLGSQGSNAQTQLNVVDTLSWSVGSHQMKFGVDYRRLTPTFDFVSYQQTINFSSVAAAVSGNVLSATIQSLAGPFYPRFTNLSLFAQDAWTLSPRLTLTYGVRYELTPVPSEKNGNDPRTVTGVDSPATIALASVGTPPFKTTYTNFAPRIGVAYTLGTAPGRESVVRAGTGIFYDSFSTQTGAAYRAFSYPYAATRALDATRYPFSPDEASQPSFSTDPPYSFVFGADPDLKLPYTIGFNVGVEQALGAHQTLSATYIRTAGRRLYRTEFYQNQVPDFVQLRVVRNLDASDYHGLQLQYRRRLSAGLQFLAQYTLAKSTDTSSSEALSYLPVAFSPVEANRGPSDFDRRHTYSFAASVQLPSPRAGTVVGALLGGFWVDLTHKVFSAAPVDVTTSALGVGLRPDVVPGVPLTVDDASAPGGRRFNREAFVARTDTNGSLGRNALRGSPFSQLDLALRRHFTIGRIGLQARVEVFNALNQTNFASPVGVLTSTSFGVPTQMLNQGLGGLNPLYQIGGPRAAQLAFRVQF